MPTVYAPVAVTDVRLKKLNATTDDGMPWLSVRGLLYAKWHAQNMKCPACDQDIDARDLDTELLVEGDLVCPDCFEGGKVVEEQPTGDAPQHDP